MLPPDRLRPSGWRHASPAFAAWSPSPPPGLPRATRPDPERRDISERPAAANERSEFGHKEGDSIEGLDSKSFLLVLRERESRFCRILKLPDKCSDTVANALIMLLRPFRASFRSLTLDNCGEFADHVRVAAELGRPDSVCFAWFHRASGKGSVEQLNGLIRPLSQTHQLPHRSLHRLGRP